MYPSGGVIRPLTTEGNIQLKITPKKKKESFENYVEQINTGDFFLRIPIEDRKRDLKRKYTEEDLDNYSHELKKIKQSYLEESPSIIDIINRDISIVQKRYLLEKVYTLANTEILSEDYSKALQAIQQFDDKANIDSYEQYKDLIMNKKMSENNKTIAMEKLRVMETYREKDTSEYAKYKHWLDTLLAVPFGEYQPIPVSIGQSSTEEIREFMIETRNILDKEISYMENPKDQILNLIAQMTRNNKCGVNAIGIYGEPGTGKSSLVRSIAKALNRPYRMISLGGESDNSVLIGHGHTYIGSCQGRIVDILKETGCMNPVILIDELDKISDTSRGREIIGTLIHLTDYTTNSRFNYDRYLSGVEFDLSQILFVFTYNDPNSVDKILADRLFKVKVEGYSFEQKYQIATTHIIPKVLAQFNYSEEEFKFSKDSVNRIISITSSKGGIRDIKRSFEKVVSRINTILLTGDSDVIRLNYKSLSSQYKQLPIEVSADDINILISKAFMEEDNSPPNGMYI
jgi:ATP-dependent Lon protease